MTLLDGDGDGIFTGTYENFTEIGEYRVVIFVVDNTGEQGRPYSFTMRTGWNLFLPLVERPGTANTYFERGR